MRSNKKLGQHFLHDENILKRLAELAELSPADTIVEIGSGLGSLTRILSAASGQVIAVEIDQGLWPLLLQVADSIDNVTAVRADFLEWLPNSGLAGNYKVVANLPYYITGAILRALLSYSPRPEMMVLTLQKEVAQRLVAQPGQMSLLSSIVQFYYNVTPGFIIKAGSFWPPPEVDSAVVKFERLLRLPIPGEQEQRFIDMLRDAFSHKRKKILTNLGPYAGGRAEIRRAMLGAGIDEDLRPQALAVEQWVALFLALNPGVTPT